MANGSRLVGTSLAAAPDIVFTALFGDYERLNEQPSAGGSTARFICFTDNAELRSDSWEIELVKPLMPWDASRSSRYIKTLAYRQFTESSRSLYIDNSVVLTEDPRELLDFWLANSKISMLPHSSRSTVADEFKACLRGGLDNPSRLKEQRKFYREALPSVLDMKPFWGGMIARRNTPDVESLMQMWFLLILRFSRRDQLSLPAAIALTGVDVMPIEGTITSSPWHLWPVLADRQMKSRVVTTRGRVRLSLGSYLRSLARRENV